MAVITGSIKFNLLDETYDRFIDSALGDYPMDNINEIIDKRIMGYGTAIDEKLMSFEDVVAMILRQREQAESFDAYYYEKTPVHRKIFADGKAALYVDEIQLNITIASETNKLQLRLSTVLEYRNDRWIAIHFHGSMAEHVAGDEDPWHVGEWRQRQAQLERQVEEKTLELINKNRELEIEASLERVRAAALSMKQLSDMLDVCRVISHQLAHFNVKDIRNIQTAIINESKSTYLNYQYFSVYEKSVTEETDAANNPTVMEMVQAMQKSADSFFSGSLKGRKLEEFREYRKKENQFPDPILEKTDAVYYHFYSIGQGGLGITTYKPLPAKDLEIFQRFHKVFKLAYRRFIDIELAMAQAREAQIQLALERIRARTMAMQHSSELAETAKVLFQRFSELDENPDQLSIAIINDPEKVLEVWLSIQGTQMNQAFRVSIDEPIVINKIYRAWKNKKKSLVIDISGKELEKYNEFRNSLPEFNEYNQLKRSKSKETNRRVMHCAFFKNGLLALATPEPRPDEAIRLLERFAGVFDITYTRFLDLKNAEAQAREAQIEAALERVRSRSMAMHSSDELVEASDVMFAQLEKLEINALRIGICTIDRETGAAEIWSRSEHKEKTKNSILGVVPLGTHPVFDGMVKTWKDNKPYFCSARKGDEVRQYYKALSPHLSYPLPKEYNKQEHISCFFFAEGSLNVISLEPLKEKERQIMIRFAKAFGQMYTRFLDLQKAEAQAREAQIELSLERIRSQVTAMRESSELLDIVVVMQAEFVKLGHEAHYFWHMRWLPDKYEKALTNGEGTRIGNVLELPRGFHGLQTMLDWEQTDEPMAVFALDPETAADYIDKMIKLGRFQEIDHSAPGPDDVRAMGGLTFVMARTTHGEIGYTLPGMVPNPPEEDVATLVRFAGVFDLAYRRFEDLQSAERRNRETQIELALERVRARTMAMQKSEELAETAVLLFEKFSELVNLPADSRSYISIFDEKRNGAEVWMTLSDGKFRAGSHFVEFTGHPLVQKVYRAWKNKQPYLVRDLSGEALKNFTSFLATFTHVKSDGGLKKMVKNPPNRLVYTDATFAQGMLGIMTYVPMDEDALNILTRFTRVFEQTYTRFLDLKNAEEQNKIIQAENERKTLELEEARQMQLSMLPKELPQLPHLDIAVHMKTATEVGGDYYDFSFSDDGSLNIAMGDATGHGMKAGIMVSAMKSIFTTNAAKMELESFFTAANSGVKSMGLRRMMMGFAMLNMNKHQFSLVNAGMPPVFLYHRASDSVEEISEHGMPIGAMRTSRYRVTNRRLEKGDVLLLMTDGMPELQNSAQEMFGYRRIEAAFRKVGQKTPAEIIDRLKHETFRWTSGKPLVDDVTFVVIKIK